MAAPGRVGKVGKTLSVALGVIWMSCGTDSPKPPAQATSQVQIIAPDFDADSAYAYVASQVAFGPRVPNTAPHDACADWLADELARHGAEVTVQEGRARAFDGTILNMKNIIGTF